MVKERHFTNIDFSRQYRRAPKLRSPKAIVGFDTETFEGRPFLLCASNKRFCEGDSLEDFLSFLWKHRYRKSLNLFWNLQYDIQGLLKWLSRGELEALYYTGKIELEGYKLLYIPKKRFSIRRKTQSCIYYDLMQFYSSSLEVAAQTYLGEGKSPIDASRMNEDGFIHQNYEEIKKYCFRDALLVEKLGQYFQKLCISAEVDFNKPISPANISERYFKQNAMLPVFENWQAQQWAHFSYHGGRFEVMKRGYIPKAYLYDINSAYPAVMSRLYHLNKGKWIFAYKDDPTYEYGFVRCWVELDQEYMNPLVHEKQNLRIYPQMKRRRKFLTIDEIRFIRKWSLGTVKIIDGWFWIPDEADFPFQKLVELYDFRAKLKSEGNALQLVYKIIMNSIYGKTVQMIPYYKRVYHKYPKYTHLDIIDAPAAGSYIKRFKAGSLFLPVYASIITARVRLQCHEAMLKAGEDVVAVFTDGIFTKRPRLYSSSLMGEWNKTGEGELLLLGCGVYTLEHKGEHITKFRGFTASKELNLFEILEENLREVEFKIPKDKVISIGEVITQRLSLTLDQLNTFIESSRTLNLNFDQKRVWDSDFRNARDALTREISSVAPTV